MILFREHEISTQFHLEGIHTIKMKSKARKDVAKRVATETPSKHAPPFKFRQRWITFRIAPQRG